jgi:hypothetical protein
VEFSELFRVVHYDFCAILLGFILGSTLSGKNKNGPFTKL